MRPSRKGCGAHPYLVDFIERLSQKPPGSAGPASSWATWPSPGAAR